MLLGTMLQEVNLKSGFRAQFRPGIILLLMLGMIIDQDGSS